MTLDELETKLTIADIDCYCEAVSGRYCDICETIFWLSDNAVDVRNLTMKLIKLARAAKAEVDIRPYEVSCLLAGRVEEVFGDDA